MTPDTPTPTAPLPQPIQPLVRDAQGVLRFQENAIVCYLLDRGGLDMNHLAVQKFSQADREQFAQLIGYSLSGFGELSYVSDTTYNAAQAMHENAGLQADAARCQELMTRLKTVQEQLKGPLGLLFGRHPDDFQARS